MYVSRSSRKFVSRSILYKMGLHKGRSQYLKYTSKFRKSSPDSGERGTNRCTHYKVTNSVVGFVEIVTDAYKFRVEPTFGRSLLYVDRPSVSQVS